MHRLNRKFRNIAVIKIIEMKLPQFKRSIGTSPGSLVYIGPEVPTKTKLQTIVYNKSSFDEKFILSEHDCRITPNIDTVFWLNVDGIHDSNVIETIGKNHNLHPLLLEDVMNTNQKPKVEYYDDKYVFVVLKMLVYNNISRVLEVEHTSFVLGEDYLISFQEERSADIFMPVLERIRASAGKTRNNKADYLLYALMDMVVDNYFLVLDKITDQITILEENVLKKSGTKHLGELYSLKRELTILRQAIYPSREIMFILGKENQDHQLINEKTYAYIRDVHDHVTQVLDSIEYAREMINGILDIHLSTQNNRMNEVMKALTIISVIFLPLNLIVGYFGMNFTDMPELEYQHGQWWVIFGMIGVSVGLISYFGYRKWL